mmetsp:Transcript_11744/g.9434  ORF Transcript_11744/g.9434 Transcript_11744/m.9434 type:complete len:89 (+) Transcript_11744:110-376(+)
MATELTFNAEMVCEGCSGAITRIMNKVEEVDSVECNMEAQQVVVKAKDGCTLDKDALLEKLLKWGGAAKKKVSLAEPTPPAQADAAAA